jgi:nucleoside-diphosphate-sugar epimerase
MKNETVMVLGCDGYIGYPLTLRLVKKGYFVIGIDNGHRRACVKRMGSESATELSSLYEREEILNNIGDFHPYDCDAMDNRVTDLIKAHKPSIIINLAHNPSAPWSMSNMENANNVLSNNILNTNKLLWDIHKYVPDSHYITIGSTGEYNHTINTDIEEGYFTFNHNDRESKRCLFPREANSIYHASKISSTYLIDYLTKLWGLKCTDIMQSIVYGLYTSECDQYGDWTRLDSDDAFGTVIHRFVVQSLLGEPMTLYGHGKHQRAFLSLNDCIQALEIAVENPPHHEGVVQTWNQLSEWHSMEQITEFVKNAIDTPCSVRSIPSPRNEFTGGHYYNLKSDILKSLGYVPTRTIEEEIAYMVQVIKPFLSDRKIEVLRSVIQPKVQF